MDPFTSFTDRLSAAFPFLGLWFVAGFAIALWNPHPHLILTVAAGIFLGFLILGPYAAAALYTMRLQRFLGGHLRWPLCIILALSAALLVAHFLDWSNRQTMLSGATAIIGTILGHDAALAVLELGGGSRPRLDKLMVGFFPLLVGLSSLAGYCSLGFGAGTYRFFVALLR
jgi:hypothetical protein